jgi:lipopolysaccharide transport system permease protein
MMAKADFQSRYKRSSLGVIWAVLVPLLQAVVLSVVFAKVIRVGNGKTFAVFVLSGVLAWSYFAAVLGTSATAIVDGATMTDKVWFPRALLTLVPVISNLPAFLVSAAVLVVAAPFLGAPLGIRLLWLLPATAALLAFTGALSLVLSALHVYFRDVRFLVAAALIVWFYVTPIAYPPQLLGGLRPFVDLNPMTGVVLLFRAAVVGAGTDWRRPLAVTAGTTLLLLVAGFEGQRRHDRLFVDLL